MGNMNEAGKLGEEFARVMRLAVERSRMPQYDGCAIHCCVIIGMCGGFPTITGYTLSDWYDATVFATFPQWGDILSGVESSLMRLAMGALGCMLYRVN